MGVLVAAGVPISLLTIFGIVSSRLTSYSLAILAVAAFEVLKNVLAVAVPTLILLHLLRAVRWLWLGIAGFVGGFILCGSHFVSMSAQPYATPIASTVILLMALVGGIVGWICASACWFTIDFLMRPAAPGSTVR
jgi:hypothetical protein